MKKLIIFFLAIALSVGVKAQYYNGKIADSTLTNVQSATFYKTVTGSKSNVTFTFHATNSSGTTAAVITLYGSLDGTNYIALASDTVSASGSFSHSYNFNGYNLYKVGVAQTGTSVTNYKVLCMYRK